MVVKVEVEDFELLVKIFVRLVWDCSNGREDIYLLGSELNVSGRENVQHQ